MINSISTKLVAVLKVTTLNRAKRTPGVDHKVYLTPSQKIKLVSQLTLDGKASPVKRISIPKALTPKLI